MSKTVIRPTEHKISAELQALRAINYDWTMHLQSVWTDPVFDSPEIHTELRQNFQDRLDDFNQDASPHSPLGWLVTGSAGTGKTHWLSVCRQQAVAREIFFVLVDMTDVRSFWDTVLQGYLDSLQHEYVAGKFQQQVLIERFLHTVGLREPVETALRKLAEYPREKLAHNVDTVLSIIQARYAQSIRHHDVIRALLAMTSHEPGVAAAGFSWLSANPVDEDCRKLLGFSQAQKQPRQIVEALSWMMSLCSPTVVAFDQLDPIVAQLDPAAQADGRELSTEGLRALAIIQEIANGLGIMRDATYRTLTVVSCLETTLAALRRYTLQTWQDRFAQPIAKLASVGTASAAEGLLYPRVKAGCERTEFSAPYPSWPLSPKALKQVDGQTPRELLKICESHRQRCLRANTVTELHSLQTTGEAPVTHVVEDAGLEQQFESLKRAANVTRLLEQSTEDERIAPLLIAGCRCLLREVSLPSTMDAVVDDFAGGKTTKPLHARIRLIDHSAGDREIHFCFRALERANPIAFQARLKGVINGSGIDKRLPFRHAMILRTKSIPGGQITEKLVTQYNDSNGRWHKPDGDEVRTLYALKELVEANSPNLESWLKTRQPASQLRMFASACRELTRPTANCEDGTVSYFGSDLETADERPRPKSRTATLVKVGTEKEAVTKPHTPISDGASSPKSVPVGRRSVGTKTQSISIPLQLLEKHTVILAGAGSGKTVLLKRLIEETALAGVPSIVIDGANDLASLGEKWPEAPADRLSGDKEKSQRFHSDADIIYWTPGREGGNHLLFEPLPDVAAVADDPEQLQLTIDAAVDALAAMVIPGKAAAENKRGILAKALRYFARQEGGNLRDFTALLAELPPEASLGIERETKLAKGMADILVAKMETNPMLRGIGTGLDPAILFGDAKKLKPGPRISIISMIGLASDDLRQQFVYQLGMSLFAWIKRHPNPPGRELRGLLIIDEAKDFVPSQKSIPSKASLQLLASQARKYHLGLVLATQNPKEIENKIIGNCATQFYGRASSPNSQQVVREQIQTRGGSGHDVAMLKPGQFYASNAEVPGLVQPVNINSPMCLSRHRTLDESEVMKLASTSRESLRAHRD